MNFETGQLRLSSLRKRKKKKKKNEQSIRELRGTIRIAKWEYQKKRRERIKKKNEEIVAGNFPNLMKNTNHPTS